MITIEDCKAFCDAPASHVEELACRECLPLVQAFARAHEMTRRNSRPVRKETAMMTMQARDMFPPRSGKTYPLRPYPANSPRAMARLVVLALLADGQLDERELAALERRGAFAALGISREDFVQVLYDFCADVARLSEQKLFLGALHAWGGSLRRGRPRDGFALRRHSLPPEAFYG